MRKRKVLAKALGVERAVVLGLDEHDGVFVLRVRVRRGDEWRCPVCQRKCGRYDSPDAPRRWRAHDFGMMRLEVEATTPRVWCPEHGVHMAHVPWARMRSRFTRAFEDTVSWLAVRTDRTTVTHLLRIAWRTVGRILGRVSTEAETTRPPLKGLRRIGIDEVSYRKGHRYLTIVVDHHVVSWATKALDEVRRSMWRELRKKGESDRARALKGSRCALMKNPGDLNRKQKSKLRDIETDNRPLFLAYLMKEQLRDVFQQRDWQGPFMLSDWIEWGDALTLQADEEGRAEHPRQLPRHLLGAAQPALQRPARSHEHQAPAPHPTRLRLPLAQPTDRPRHAQARWPLSAPPERSVTHDHVRRPLNFRRRG